MLRRNALGLGGILRRVDVEERIDRLGRPVGDGDAVPRGPDLDLVQAFARPAPGADRRAAPPATAPTTGCRHSPERAQASGAPARRARLMQPRHQIARQERAVARHARRHQAMSGACAAAQSSPARMPASGPAKSGTLVGHDRQPGVGEARRIAIGVEDDAGALRPSRASTRSRMVAPPIADARLVAAAHAARQPAGEHEAEGRRHGLSRHAPPPCAGAWRFPPRRRRGPDRTRCGPRRRARRSACRARGRSA